MDSDQRSCTTCPSKGFGASVLGAAICTLCDGTEEGQPPTSKDVRACAFDAGGEAAWVYACSRPVHPVEDDAPLSYSRAKRAAAEAWERGGAE